METGNRQHALAGLVRAQRQAQGWSQRRLAREAGVDPSVISLTEAGKQRPHPDTLAKLGPALGLPVGDLCRAAGYPSDAPPQHDPLAIIRRMLLLGGWPAAIRESVLTLLEKTRPAAGAADGDGRVNAKSDRLVTARYARRIVDGHPRPRGAVLT